MNFIKKLFVISFIIIIATNCVYADPEDPMIESVPVDQLYEVNKY